MEIKTQLEIADLLDAMQGRLRSMEKQLMRGFWPMNGDIETMQELCVRLRDKKGLEA